MWAIRRQIEIVRRETSSTWTYLINDHPFGDWFERFYRTVANSGDLMRSLKRALTDHSSGQ